jgi:hypothetical protein
LRDRVVGPSLLSLERALGEPVHILATERGARVHAPAADVADAAWPKVMDALRTADRWGSSSTHGIPEVWAEVDEVNT